MSHRWDEKTWINDQFSKQQCLNCSLSRVCYKSGTLAYYLMPDGKRTRSVIKCQRDRERLQRYASNIPVAAQPTPNESPTPTRALPKVDREYDREYTTAKILEATENRTPMVRVKPEALQARAAHFHPVLAARLSEALVFMQLMYADMVEHDLDTKSRRLVGEFLGSQGYKEWIKELNS